MKIFLDMVGCRLNQAEIEILARQFRAAGNEIVASPADADLAVINTCTVTTQAAGDSRQKIRHAAHLGAERIIATGCWATLEPQTATGLPGVTGIVPNSQKDHLVSEVLELSPEAIDPEPIARMPLPGLRARTRAFIKVQDGCDNACTFCITSVARGKGRSIPLETVLADIRSALAGGTKEIILTGVHLGSWGGASGLHLRHLVTDILKETDVPRLRLSSLEPWDLDGDFFSIWQDTRLMRHLHLPLQSGSTTVLKRMARKTTPGAYRDLIAAARAAIPDVAITTDVMTGFPGETAEEFAETLTFVREVAFAGGHVFTYSARPGTAAERMKGQVPHEVRKERSAILRTAFQEMAQTYRRRFIGQTLSVLWESSSKKGDGNWQLEGLTGNYLRVTAPTSKPKWNQVEDVVLTGMTEAGLVGELLREG